MPQQSGGSTFHLDLEQKPRLDKMKVNQVLTKQQFNGKCVDNDKTNKRRKSKHASTNSTTNKYYKQTSPQTSTANKLRKQAPQTAPQQKNRKQAPQTSTANKRFKSKHASPNKRRKSKHALTNLSNMPRADKQRNEQAIPLVKQIQTTAIQKPITPQIQTRLTKQHRK